jgi:predicted  nucleic acid-binding Zn-ribbon protein
MKLADAFVEIKGDKGKFSATIRGAKRETDGFAKSATRSLKRVSLGIGLITTAALAASVAIGVKLTKAVINAGRATIQTALKYDKLKRGLTAVVGSAEEAERQLARLKEAAKLPGLSFPQAIQGSINLQAAGLSAELSERALKAFGNALVTVGKGAEDLAGVNLALTQIANKTSGFGQDVRQLQERLPQMQTALKNAFDGKPLEDLEITGKELVAVLVTEFEKLEKASDGPANKLVNLGMAYEQLKATVGATMLDIVGTSADSMTKIIENIAEVLPHWKKYASDLTVVFTEIATITLKLTGEMMKGIGAIIAAAAPLVYKPLKYHGMKWAKDFAAGAGLVLNDLLKKIGAIDTKKYEQNIVEVMNALQDSQKESAASFKKEYEEAINNIIKVITTKMPEMTAAFGEAIDKLGAVGETLDDIVTEIDIEGAVEKPLKKTEKTTLSFKDTLSGLELVWDANKQAAASFGMIAAGHLENLIELGIRAKEIGKAIGDLSRAQFEEVGFLKLETEDPKNAVRREMEAARRIADFRSDIDKEMVKRQQTNLNKFIGFRRQREQEELKSQQAELERFREHMRQQQEAAQSAANAIRPVFENMFTDFFGGRTKDLWTRFWEDLKQIAIRKLAETCLAAQVLPPPLR